jgi:hypothetical protein
MKVKVVEHSAKKYRADSKKGILDGNIYETRLQHAPSLIKEESSSLLWILLILGEKGLEDLMAPLDIIVDEEWCRR